MPRSLGHRSRVRALLTGLALALGMAAPVVVAAPAQALPTCYQTWYVNLGYYYYHLPNANGTTSCIMGQGNTSSAVKVLQRALNRCYGKSLTVDGVYGWRTRDALKSVQRAIGVADDGIYGPVTGRRMKWVAYLGNSASATEWYCAKPSSDSWS